MNITSSLLSESSEEIQDFLQRKNKYICLQEALTCVCFPFCIVKSYRKSVSNVCIYRLSPSSGTNTSKCKQTFVKDIFIGKGITHEAFRTTSTFTLRELSFLLYEENTCFEVFDITKAGDWWKSVDLGAHAREMIGGGRWGEKTVVSRLSRDYIYQHEKSGVRRLFFSLPTIKTSHQEEFWARGGVWEPDFFFIWPYIPYI